MDFPALYEAIRALGATNKQRGRALGVSAQAVSLWLAGRRVPSIEVIARHPATVAAFCRDATAQFAKENASAVPET